ncbi:MAG: 4Fe-4S dicluster domain-containing protein [Erysipelotrichaceae bacterium]
MDKNLIFDTNVQLLKNKVLTKMAKLAYEDRLIDIFYDVPEQIVGKKPSMRCCIYKEKAIIQERIKYALGGNRSDASIIEVIDIACDECPVDRFQVGSACRGCISKRCEHVCPKDAISFIDNRAYINQEKCISCGKCAQACPYGAINEHIRPCMKACKIKAISMDADQKAKIDKDKCVECGACMQRCPFGAITDKSYIIDAIEMLKNKKNQPVFALIAPAFATQFAYTTAGKVVAALEQIGFKDVFEAALGADMVSLKESEELLEKGFLTSSCCPAFVNFIEKAHPAMLEHVSHNASPMVEMGRFIKAKHPNAKVIFIGPCTAKKMEMKRDHVQGAIDAVLTFEELQALFDANEINFATIEPKQLDQATYFGRIFGRSGGLSEAVKATLIEKGIEFDLRAERCEGLDQCNVALLKATKKVGNANFIEGMACSGGCIGGAGCISYSLKDRATIDNFSKTATKKSLEEAVLLAHNVVKA